MGFHRVAAEPLKAGRKALEEQPSWRERETGKPGASSVRAGD